jgi:hypothetical protein
MNLWEVEIKIVLKIYMLYTKLLSNLIICKIELMHDLSNKMLYKKLFKTAKIQFVADSSWSDNESTSVRSLGSTLGLLGRAVQ